MYTGSVLLYLRPGKGSTPLHFLWACDPLWHHVQDRREREQQDLELAKEIAEDEEEDFP